ncbi:MAG: sulfatase [Acidobacteriota bacterium]
MRPTAVLALLLLTACGPPPPAEISHSWQRYDLWTARPEIEQPTPRRGRSFERRLDNLGLRSEKDVGSRKYRARRAGSLARSLGQQGGTRLAWPVDLPAEAYLSFIPLGSPNGACRCRYRAGVRDADGIVHELWASAVETDGVLAPATLEIDLSRFGDTAIEILFQIDPLPGVRLTEGVTPWALWGSPALYRRLPVKPTAPTDRPDILLLGLDTLRADSLGPRGFEPSLTPAIDRLASESDVWSRAFSAFNVTNPSFTSILTGLYGKNHGIYDLITPLPEDHETLAELLAEAGYRTLAIISARHLGPRVSGLGQGFEEVVVTEEVFAGELVVDMAIDFIADHQASDDRRPLFIWLHLFDSHTPHTPPQPWASGLRAAEPYGLGSIAGWSLFRQPGPREYEERVLGGQVDLYHGEVAYLDRQIDRLTGFLAGIERLDSTLLALVADHGENLGDHGVLYRHNGLWDTTTHVPLMIRWPDGQVPLDAAGRPHRGRRLDALVQSIDLFPTLLSAAAVEAPESDGLALQEHGEKGRRVVFSEHAHGHGAMVRTDDHKLISTVGSPFQEDGYLFYDLAEDPNERQNLAGQGDEEEERLIALLERWLSSRRPAPKATAGEVTEEDRERLRALGYL